MTDLGILALSLGVSDRTLRRAAERGTLRCHRHSPRRLEVHPAEAVYLVRRWPLLHSLVAELRTLPDVRLAVLFGSTARGDDGAGSDLDVLVRFSEPSSLRGRTRLADRLQAAAQRDVQLVSLDDASPLVLRDVLRDGRVLVDRDGDWPRLRRRARAIEAAAAAEQARLDDEVASAFADFLPHVPAA